jgi:hypothetical protein
LDQRLILHWHTTKIENRDLLKALKEMMVTQIGFIAAERKAIQVKADSNRKERKADREGLLAKLEAKIKANQAKTNVKLKEMREEIKSGEAEMRSRVSDIGEKMEAAVRSLRAWPEETIACQELTEARLECKKPTSEDMEAEYREVPKEHAAVETGRAPDKRHRGRNLVAERHQKPRERTRGNCGSRKKLVVAGMKMTRRSKVARRKGNVVRKNRTRDNVEKETRKERTLGKRKRSRQEGGKGIKDVGGRQPLYLRNERTTANGIRERLVRNSEGSSTVEYSAVKC